MNTLPSPPHAREEIGRRLKATRLALGLRARDIHRATGIGESAWSQYENGRRFPDLLQILPFADRFGVSLDWIYRGIPTALPFELAQNTLAHLAASPSDEPEAPL
ncbi:transcriptional regulator with XRE-family HTH domain [Azospirillum fermentarium]|uniref:helix-turn-helix domain-containing protein n=1 Tax=Azospirillum fermentarium TaxID=1233114 RepID=UPI002225DF00|nr:helix-turn-helix transcriptional regulator [Azospirillum fermentarium]MCW2245202.1 transcriptional regulator with XRE-family HTH domain [Azospirillum fermentarium]